jgi:hypothetical protein
MKYSTEMAIASHYDEINEFFISVSKTLVTKQLTTQTLIKTSDTTVIMAWPSTSHTLMGFEISEGVNKVLDDDNMGLCSLGDHSDYNMIPPN